MPDPLPIVPAAIQIRVPDGAAGTRETLKHMRTLAQLGKTDLGLRDLAANVVAQAPAKDWPAELAALLDFVRGQVRYTLDSNDIEVIQGPAETLALGYGDCDDLAILLATLCECAGHPAAFIALGFERVGDYTHVMVLASGAGETNWIPLDASEGQAAGWFPPGVTCQLICPISDAAARGFCPDGKLLG